MDPSGRSHGQSDISKYFSSPKTNQQGGLDGQAASTKVEDKGVTALDEDSRKGRFGFFKLADKHVPFIYRSGQEYVSIKMFKSAALKKYLGSLPKEIEKSVTIASYSITDVEAALLNEINSWHCKYHLHKDSYNRNDRIIEVSEAEAFYKFLETCHKKLCVKPVETSDNCGFMEVDGSSVFPYTVQGGVKYVPFFFFEDETDTLKEKTENICKWELAYLKFCFIVQGLKDDIVSSEECPVVTLDALKRIYPTNTQFKEHWPTLISRRLRLGTGTPRLQLEGIVLKPTHQHASEKPVNRPNLVSFGQAPGIPGQLQLGCRPPLRHIIMNPSLPRIPQQLTPNVTVTSVPVNSGGRVQPQRASKASPQASQDSRNRQKAAQLKQQQQSIGMPQQRVFDQHLHQQMQQQLKLYQLSQQH